MRIAYDQRHSFDGGEFLRGALSVTTGDQDARLGMVAMHAAHSLTNFVVGSGGHGAGVKNDQPSIAGAGGGRKSFGRETRFDGGSIGLRGSAAEILDPEPFHLFMVTG